MKETITITGQGADTAAVGADRNNKQVIFKNCAPFADCDNEINNTLLDYAQDLDAVMPKYDFIAYSNKYSKTSESL